MEVWKKHKLDNWASLDICVESWCIHVPPSIAHFEAPPLTFNYICRWRWPQQLWCICLVASHTLLPCLSVARQTDRQTDRQTQTDILSLFWQTDRQTDRQTDTPIVSSNILSLFCIVVISAKLLLKMHQFQFHQDSLYFCPNSLKHTRKLGTVA